MQIGSGPATGERNRDVDDGLAFLVLLALPNIKVEEITFSYGSVGADIGYGVAKNLIDFLRVGVPVYKGAETKNGFRAKEQSSRLRVCKSISPQNDLLRFVTE